MSLPMHDPVNRNEKFEEKIFFVEPFLAWRAWNIELDAQDQPRLYSVSHRVVWVPGEPLEAICVRGPCLPSPQAPHKAPDVIHSCGIHAVLDRESALEWHGYGAHSTKYRCIGEVKLWGEIYRFTRGYLAEYAYPVNLFVQPDNPPNMPETPDVIKGLRRAYRGVEVRMM